MTKSGFVKLAKAGGIPFAAEAARVYGICVAQIDLWILSVAAQ